MVWTNRLFCSTKATIVDCVMSTYAQEWAYTIGSFPGFLNMINPGNEAMPIHL